MNKREREKALETAVRDAVATHAERAQAPRPMVSPQRQLPWIALILVGWVAIGWIWYAKPAAIFGEEATREVPVAEREARLRFAIYLQHQDIEAFRQDSGRIPNSLQELGAEDVEGITLTFEPNGTWALEGTDRELSVRLAEGMSADSFLGNSLELLRQAP